MTRLRKEHPDSVSNWLNQLLAGVGHRGSSFMDIDLLKIVNDGPTDRFLFIELKDRDEKQINRGQERTLVGLARVPHHTVIGIHRQQHRRIDLRHFNVNSLRRDVSEEEARIVVSNWWNVPLPRTTNVQRCKHRDEFKKDGRCWICMRTGRVADGSHV